MKISARNQLKAKVKSITVGAINVEVVLSLSGGEELVSVITKGAASSLNLKVGDTAYAFIKASNVLVGTD